MSIGQRAMPRGRTQQDRRPVFVVRAPDPNNRGRWVSLGVAWARRDGEPGYTVRLNSVPVGNWDGTLVLLPPLDNDQMSEELPEQQELPSLSAARETY